MNKKLTEQDLERFITDFSIEKLRRLFEVKLGSSLKVKEIPLDPEDFDDFRKYFETEKVYRIEREDGEEEIPINEDESIVVYAIRTKGSLSERSSKKRQFDLAKKLITTDGGFFLFYDDEGNFRFSFVHKIYRGRKEEYSPYKRYTYFVQKGKPYRTFKKALFDLRLDSIESIVESAFRVQPLIKEFYEEIQNWYAWALKDNRVWFPGGKKEENLIRLITRLVFVWFLKEMGLIPEEIFDEERLSSIVKNFKEKDHYYNVILQNLFFATLNREIKKRQFAEEGEFFKNIQHFGLKNLYRYRRFLNIAPEEFLKLFEKTPFVNGGLFECLDEDHEYIDGFSRNENKRARIPDEFFFSEERWEDLSYFYGSNARRKVRGLIKILKDYNFTADESTPLNVEVSLDPELLGHIFENLLASYNEETKDTARKHTGSYYTPKEIVDFMVEESLVEYFRDKAGIEEDKIRKLLSYDEKVELTEEDIKRIISAIDQIKVLDPAVGSGAFPMGVLHKLVYILEKIDPNNELWYELQYQKALEEAQKILKVEDKDQREELLKELNENFDEAITYPDYARKLYILQNSIYGVDIQNIAIQITKLRFFLSLIIDQKPDQSKENFGIKPLPHLETNFITANTLISLERQGQQRVLESPKITQLKEKLKELYKKHFSIRTREEKKRIQEKAKNIREKIKKELERIGYSNDVAQKIADFDIFDQLARADWFDPDWMFGVKSFDLVIGNPPYVRQERIKDLKPILRDQGYFTFEGTADLYVYFYERGYNLLKEKGILCYISSNKWMRAKYGQKLRKFLKEKTTLLRLIDFKGYSVFEQTVDTEITLLKKEKPADGSIFWYVDGVPSNTKDHEGAISFVKENLKSMLQSKLSEDAFVLGEDKVLQLKEKIEKIGKPLREWDVRIYFGIKTGFNEAFIIDSRKREEILANCKDEEERKRTEEIIKPILRGRDIGRYYYRWAGLWLIKIESGWTNKNRGKEDPEKYFKNTYTAIYNHLISFKDYKGKGKGLFNRDDQGDYWWELRDCDYYPEFEKEKIVWQEMSDYPSFAYDENKFYTNQTAYIATGQKLKFILGILNSKISHFYLLQTAYSLSGQANRWIKQYVARIPIPPITPQNKPIAEKIESLVNQILSITQSEDYPSNPQKQSKVKDLEKEIDKLVYNINFII
ncbi:MAG: Eco57I restriction-modification methylase domain-containing protein [Aquificaceae bacterium]